MWFRKDKTPKEPREQKTSKVPEGLWVKCEGCREILYNKELARNFKVCPKCGHHFRLSAPERLRMLFDDEKFVEHDLELRSADPLKFRDSKRYRDRLREYEESVGRSEAVRVASGTMGGIPVVIGAMEFFFLGGSMGSVVGEKVTRGVERSLAERRPLILVSTSGGARMQEGILSLMQMAKTSVVLAELAQDRIPFISLLTNPTTGGVSASYAMQGDVILAEPGAVIGFAGPRVIKQTIGQDLPEGFQTAEFLLEHGMLDAVVPRGELRDTTAQLLRHMTGARPAEVAD